MKFDFSGYATKNGLKCSDGRTIMQDAFKDNDGSVVPLVWQHIHNDPGNVIGHAQLQNRGDGVYAYCTLNDTEAGSNAKQLVEHGDVNALSIYANQLVQRGSNVIHGAIREVSLVLAGANPGALIDNVSFQHGDDSEVSEEDAIIYTGLTLQHEQPKMKGTDMAHNNQALSHAEDQGGDSGETVQDVFDSLSEKQKQVVYYLVGQAASGNSDSEVAQSAEDDEDYIEHSSEEGNIVKHNIFEGDSGEFERPHLSHSQIKEIVTDAERCGSFKESFLAHAQEYGIENIDILFPDAKTVTSSPDFIKRRTEWVAGVLNGTRHSPFSRIKSTAANITADEARAKGYIKGNLKKEEVFPLLKRVTTPTTIYKKQKLDRDDITDITDLDVVAFLKQEMRLMLDEELARAILVGDGRAVDDEDKIKDPGKIDGVGIRSIYTDDDLYSIHTKLAAAASESDVIKSIVKAQKDYEGSGTPTLYTTPDVLTDLLLQEDTIGRRLYPTTAELASALRVSSIVEVPILKDLTRTDPADNTKTLKLLGIIVNLTDYTVGADKGGEVSLFDDFDIDYNQYKYLIETRVSGTLTHPHSALVLEQYTA